MILISLLIAILTAVFWALSVLYIVILLVSQIGLFESPYLLAHQDLSSMLLMVKQGGVPIFASLAVWMTAKEPLRRLLTSIQTPDWLQAGIDWVKGMVAALPPGLSSILSSFFSSVDASGQKVITAAAQAAVVKAIERFYGNASDPVEHIDLTIRSRSGKSDSYHYGKDAAASVVPVIQPVPAAAERAPAQSAAVTPNPSQAAPSVPAAASPAPAATEVKP